MHDVKISILFFICLVSVINRLRPANFPQKYLHVLSRPKHANFGLKWNFWGKKAHILYEKKHQALLKISNDSKNSQIIVYYTYVTKKLLKCHIHFSKVIFDQMTSK